MAHTRIRSYRDLLVWQKARMLVRIVYDLSEQLPPTERYGFASQLRRAAVSITSNLAEGWGRGTRAELRRSALVARGSCAEVSSLLDVGENLELVTGPDEARDLADEVGRMLTGLVRALERKGVGK